MADQPPTNSIQHFSDDEGVSGPLVAPHDKTPYFAYFDVPTTGVNDDYNSAGWPPTWPAPCPAGGANANLSVHSPPTVTPQDAQILTPGFIGNRSGYPMFPAIEHHVPTIEPEMLQQAPIPSTEKRRKMTTSKSAKHHPSSKPPAPTPKHPRETSLARESESPDPPQFVPERDEAGADGGEAAQPLDKQAAEGLRRQRNRDATKKSHRKKKKHIEELERREQDLSAEYNCLCQEKATLESEKVRLRQHILHHRNCGSDIIDAYISASARGMTMEATRDAAGSRSTNVGSTLRRGPTDLFYHEQKS